MILVDTSAWCALYVRDDPDHTRAVGWFSANQLPLVTTDYIYDEIVPLLRARGERQRAPVCANYLVDPRNVTFARISKLTFDKAFRTFLTYRDKNWSFTDCTSKAVMEELGTTTAFTSDHHFTQFGNVRVVPL